MFTESKIIKQITILPQSGGVNVQWANQIKKDDVVISETFERKAYETSLTGFNVEVGSLDVNAFLASFNAAAIEERDSAAVAKATAESALATAQAQVATLQAQIDAYTPPVVVEPTAVTSVTMRQARLALLGAGLLDDVTAAIAALPEPDKTAALIEWEYAATVERSSGLIPSMATALGMTGAQLDALFATAKTL